MQGGEEKLHGYKILKDLTEKTNEMLVIEEGTLYPILRKLEVDGIIKSEKETTGRKRKFYMMTDYGERVFNHLAGFYSKFWVRPYPYFVRKERKLYKLKRQVMKIIAKVFPNTIIGIATLKK